MRYILVFFLYPFTFLWDGLYRLRRFLYLVGFFNSRSFKVPIISVGNITFGGTGKTPFIIWLSEYIRGQGKRVMILSRGYKSKFETSSGLIAGSSRFIGEASDFGDEPVLLARRLKNVPIAVGKKRADNLAHYFEKEMPDVVLLDDGHQHLNLRRDANLLLFDATMSMERYKVAPLGYLREGMSSLGDADVIVIGHSDVAGIEQVTTLKKAIKEYVRDDVIWAEVGHRPKGLFNRNYDRVFDKEKMNGVHAIAIAGIATPEHFFSLLEKLGVVLIGKYPLPDHHTYTQKEFREYQAVAKHHSAIVVTTEKDMVKMRKFVEDEETLFLQIDVEFFSGEEQVKEYIQGVVSYEIC